MITNRKIFMHGNLTSSIPFITSFDEVLSIFQRLQLHHYLPDQVDPGGQVRFLPQE